MALLLAAPARADESFGVEARVRAYPGLSRVLIALESDALLGRTMRLDRQHRDVPTVERLSASLRLPGFGDDFAGDDVRDLSRPALVRVSALRLLRDHVPLVARLMREVSAKLIVGVEHQLDESDVNDMRALIGGGIEYSF